VFYELQLLGIIVEEGLELLEESYIEGRYGEVSYLESQGRTCVGVLRRVLEVLEKIELELAREAIKRLELLRNWRGISELVANAARGVIGEDLMAVYVVGSIAKGKAGVYSDIDVVLVVSNPKYKNIDTVIEVKLKAEELGVPIEAPIDVKILTEEGFNEYTKTLYRKRVIVK